MTRQGLFFKSLKIGFAAKHIHVKKYLFIVFVVLPVHTFCLQCSKSNTNTYIDCKCLYLLAAVIVCVACCVAFVIQLRNIV